MEEGAKNNEKTQGDKEKVGEKKTTLKELLTKQFLNPQNCAPIFLEGWSSFTEHRQCARGPFLVVNDRLCDSV